MDKTWKQELAGEARDLGLDLGEGQVEALAAHVDLLLKWNARVNLTRITEPREVRVKHVLDSLAALRLCPSTASTVLDLGSGAGFPGIPWLIARPGLRVTMADSVAKKVSFVKTALAQLKLARGRAIHVRLGGEPEAEGVGQAEVVVSRAFTNLEDFLRLGQAYLAPGGSIVAMLGRREGEATAAQIAANLGFELAAAEPVTLAHGMGERLVVRAVPRGTG